MVPQIFPFVVYFFATQLFVPPLQLAFVFMEQSMRDVLIFVDTGSISVPISVMIISFPVLFVLKPTTKRLAEKV